MRKPHETMRTRGSVQIVSITFVNKRFDFYANHGFKNKFFFFSSYVHMSDEVKHYSLGFVKLYAQF